MTAHTQIKRTKRGQANETELGTSGRIINDTRQSEHGWYILDFNVVGNFDFNFNLKLNSFNVFIYLLNLNFFGCVILNKSKTFIFQNICTFLWIDFNNFKWFLFKGPCTKKTPKRMPSVISLHLICYRLNRWKAPLSKMQ